MHGHPTLPPTAADERRVQLVAADRRRRRRRGAHVARPRRLEPPRARGRRARAARRGRVDRAVVGRARASTRTPPRPSCARIAATSGFPPPDVLVAPEELEALQQGRVPGPETGAEAGPGPAGSGTAQPMATVTPPDLPPERGAAAGLTSRPAPAGQIVPRGCRSGPARPRRRRAGRATRRTWHRAAGRRGPRPVPPRSRRRPPSTCCRGAWRCAVDLDPAAVLLVARLGLEPGGDRDELAGRGREQQRPGRVGARRTSARAHPLRVGLGVDADGAWRLASLRIATSCALASRSVCFGGAAGDVADPDGDHERRGDREQREPRRAGRRVEAAGELRRARPSRPEPAARDRRRSAAVADASSAARSATGRDPRPARRRASARGAPGPARR